MSDLVFDYHPIFPLGEDSTVYKKLSGQYVSMDEFNGKPILKIDPEALTLLSKQAFADISHLLRSSHLQQLAKILDDPESSDNDRFVAYDLLKNANIAAGGVLPMCQDTGTAIVMGKKGQNVWTGASDEAAISRGIFATFQERNLRYSQVSPLSMYEETNTKIIYQRRSNYTLTRARLINFFSSPKVEGPLTNPFCFRVLRHYSVPSA